MMTQAEIIALTIKLEGGFVDNPADPGGRTNMGITQKYLDHVNAHAQHSDPTMPTDVKDLTVANVTHLYEVDQWVTTGAAVLPPALAALAFDGGVNEGPGTAVMLLQQALGTKVDQQVGSTTLKAVEAHKADYNALALEYAARRATHYAALNKAAFELGWMRRLLTVYTAAIKPE
jgi:lysozyme family protein